MRIKRLEISTPYRALRAGAVALSPADGYSAAYRELYGPMNVTLLAGPNGSGKSTLLRLIHNAFFRLERDPEKVPVDLSVAYEIDLDGETREVELAFEQGKAVVDLGDGLGRRRISKYNKRRGHPSEAEPGEVLFAHVVPLLPKVIVSAFSVHGEFPERPANFGGHRVVETYDTSLMYGKHHYSLPSLSRGIARLAKMFLAGDERLTVLEEGLGIRFRGEVVVYSRYAKPSDEVTALPYERRPVRADKEAPWVKCDAELVAREVAEEVYFNDISLERDGRHICLGNMSSGEKMLFIRVLSLLSSYEKNALVILEEPELHLDPAWTKQLITLLRSLFGAENSHFLVSTHSHSLINAVLPENLLLMSRGETTGKAEPLFLANHSTVAGALFQDWAAPNYVEHFVSQLAATRDVATLRAWLSRMGESPHRFRVFRVLAELERQESASASGDEPDQR